MFDYHRAQRFGSEQGKCSRGGDENRTRMTSLKVAITLRTRAISGGEMCSEIP